MDFGQNFAGYVSFKVEAEKGKIITLRFGEMLTTEGEFTQKNIQLTMGKKTTPLQRVEYVCKDGLNEYKTRFAIFGFQYVEVETDLEIKTEDFVGNCLKSCQMEVLTSIWIL